MMEHDSDHEEQPQRVEPQSSTQTTEPVKEEAAGIDLWGYWNKATTLVHDIIDDHPDEVDYLKSTLEKGKEISIDMAKKAKEGVEAVGLAFDPLAEIHSDDDDLKFLVTSLQLPKIKAVQNAVSRVFPVSNSQVSGASGIESNIANQPVGFAAGQLGAENRILSLKCVVDKEGIDLEKSLIVSIESFIVEIEGNWFDMACVILRDEENDMSLVSYSQGVRVPTKYVENAREATANGYRHEDTGYMVTAGEYLAEDLGTNPNEWHGAISNGQVTRSSLIEMCVVGLLGEYTLALRKKRSELAETVRQQPSS